MSSNERRYERALTALKTIARTMGNFVFRVEDYRPPHLRSRIGRRGARGEEQQGNAKNPPASNRASRS